MRIFVDIMKKNNFVLLMKKNLCFFAIGLFSCATAFATDYTLNAGVTSSSWATEKNWSPNGVPTSKDNVLITGQTATTGVEINSFTEVNNLKFSDLIVINRFFIRQYSAATVSGDITVGDIYLAGGSTYRCPALRGTADLVVKGSILFDATGKDKTVDTTTYKSLPYFNLGGDWKNHTSKSIELGENAAVNKTTGFNTAINLDTSSSKVAQQLSIAVASNADKGVVVHNVAQLNYTNNQKTAKLVIAKMGGGFVGNQNISIGGVNGFGILATEIGADTTNSLYGVANLTFTNAAGVNTTFSGNLERSVATNLDTITLTMNGDGKQTVKITGGTADVLTAVNVKKGTLDFTSINNGGALAISGGSFSAIDGGATFSSANISGGKIAFAAEPILGGTADKLTISGKFTKATADKIVIDFQGIDGESVLGATYDLISAGTYEGISTSEDADKYFTGINISNAFANFGWKNNTLQVTFTSVPEPAAIAAILGALALGFAAYRRRS